MKLKLRKQSLKKSLRSVMKAAKDKACHCSRYDIRRKFLAKFRELAGIITVDGDGGDKNG